MSVSSQTVTLYVGSDHAGFPLKKKLVDYLKETRSGDKFKVEDLGISDEETKCDYPDYAAQVAKKVTESTSDSEIRAGLLVCGTGIGMSIAANKVGGARCALCHDHYTAVLSRQHNDANILAVGSRSTGPDVAKEILDAFLDTEFLGQYHSVRIEKIHQLEH
ncbi:Ribose/galactose isomerase [Basidiobolus meristosporus CBS 931.73]|uniref:Ribose/galactose isomerase n=1 Tax=Basidiobolus meristosporus CBS 931.73 TaxID=1314790 RepID=A0A1Y1ZC28_9FUNG|nr:Ribose/galactose isomerase [Basidiobolus meristosporus CBS 931.73]|eukprot:ORY07851.1 Ribose/galactose isomerase [Basidiobolus meristosporus CBS 931.73]